MDTGDNELQAALAGVLQLAGMQPGGDISAQELREATGKIRMMLAQLKKATDGQSVPPAVTTTGKHQNVLIAGQLGIILHQMRQTIEKLGGDVSIVKDVDAAIADYQKKDYSLVIVDLFMPTEREGLMVLDEIKKLSVLCHIPTQIIVLAPLSKDKTLRDRCKSKGAAIYLEKVEGWHKIILQYYQGEITADQVEQD